MGDDHEDFNSRLEFIADAFVHIEMGIKQRNWDYIKKGFFDVMGYFPEEEQSTMTAGPTGRVSFSKEDIHTGDEDIGKQNKKKVPKTPVIPPAGEDTGRETVKIMKVPEALVSDPEEVKQNRERAEWVKKNSLKPQRSRIISLDEKKNQPLSEDKPTRLNMNPTRPSTAGKKAK